MIDLRGATYEHPTLGTVRLDEADADTLRLILAEVLEMQRIDQRRSREERNRLLNML